MRKETLKSCMARDKAFLKELYANANVLKNKRVLNGANDNQLNTLISYLHYLSNGEIKINKKNFDAIKKRIAFLRQKVEKKKNYLDLLNNDRTEKLLFLNKLCPYYSNLLYGVFNLP